MDATEASSFPISGTRGQADDAWLEVVATREHEVIDGLEITCSVEEGALVRVIHDRAASSSSAEE